MQRMLVEILITAGLVLPTLAMAAPAASPPPAAPAPAKDSPPAPATDPLAPISDRANAFREAANFLEKAKAALANNNRNFADQLFTSAELLVGPEAVAELAPRFREGAPPRVQVPTKQLPKDSAPQPSVVGGSEDEADEKVEAPTRGALTGKLILDGKSWEGRGVVLLEPVGVKWSKRTPKQRVMEQRNRQFAPRILMVPVGSTVAFPNFDNIYHNVFSRTDAKAFDLGMYKNGQSREQTFDKEGIVRLGCNLHSNMAGYVVVVAAPHYAVTNDKGEFFFKSLAPGKYKMKAWSERTKEPLVKEILIKAGSNTSNVTLNADAPVGPGVDKFGAPRG